MNLKEVVVLGSGPAGLTAAIYTSRANLNPLVIEGEPSSTTDQPGGQLMLTTEIENFPGFLNGIMGPELMSTMRGQAERFGTEFVTAKATKVDLSSRPFKIWTGDPQEAEPTYSAKALIIATGARSLLLGLPSEIELLGHGVSTCATCDGFFFKGQEVAVVGGGDSALEEALFLAKFASKVIVVHRRKELRASKIMQERAFKNPKLEFQWDSVVDEIIGTESVSGLKIRDVNTGEKSVLPVTGLFVAIGHSPNTDLFKNQLEMNDAGYIITKLGTKTNIEGVFACGDVQDDTYRQAITAAGSGCMAAIDTERWLESQLD